nr:anti-SIV gp148 Ig heavy chain {CDR3 heavy chain region} [Macaca fascicularis=cynomolgus monkey, Peptide Partial, 16 aa] [Macaca fascicularis]
YFCARMSMDVWGQGIL